MSFRAVSWAFDQVRGLSATSKLVLLALAEFANDEDITWRSRDQIAARAECSVSMVNKAVRVLQDAGLVSSECRLFTVRPLSRLILPNRNHPSLWMTSREPANLPTY